jgi:hypothetical protein
VHARIDVSHLCSLEQALAALEPHCSRMACRRWRGLPRLPQAYSCVPVRFGCSCQRAARERPCPCFAFSLLTLPCARCVRQEFFRTALYAVRRSRRSLCTGPKSVGGGRRVDVHLAYVATVWLCVRTGSLLMSVLAVVLVD